MVHRLPPVTYTLDLSKGIDVNWQLTRVSVSEAINRPYRATLDVHAELDDFDTEQLLGVDVALTLCRGEERAPRAVCGIVAGVDLIGHEHGQLLLRLHVCAALELLDQQLDSRIWQHCGIREILTDVLERGLDPYARDFHIGAVGRSSRAREYCTQYRESDFAFISRLLEEEGISYVFTHHAESRRECFALRDDNDDYAKLINVDGTHEVPIIAAKSEQADVESIQHFEWCRTLTSTSILRRDYDWQTPHSVLSASIEHQDARGRSRRRYVHGRRRLEHDDLEERVRDRSELDRQEGRVARGRSNATAMRPGLRFWVSGHDHAELDREYLITEVEHRGSEQAYTSGTDQGEGEGYSNEFSCVPIDVVVRPPLRTPRPREYGPQTAIVTGPSGAEIHTDEHGRIQVQFYWQEDPSYGPDSSCWIRCVQSWAGMGWGTQFIPRVGMEVVVEFLEGNPDRPLVTGCVYNAAYPPPFALPDRKTQSGWQSESSPGGGGANILRFEDALGSEEIYLHAEQDWAVEVERDEREHVGRDEQVEIGRDRRERVGNDERVEVVRDRHGEIGRDQEHRVGRDQTTTILANRSESIGADASESVEGSKTVSVDKLMELRVGGDLRVSVRGDANVSVDGNRLHGIGGDERLSVTGELSIEAEAASITTKVDTNVQADGKVRVEAADNLDVRSGAEVVVEATDKLVLKCGEASITIGADGKVSIVGKDIDIKGSGKVVVKGQQLAGN